MLPKQVSRAPQDRQVYVACLLTARPSHPPKCAVRRLSETPSTSASMPTSSAGTTKPPSISAGTASAGWLGETLQMQYTLEHFMGARFGLFNFATEEAGGYVDFLHYTPSDLIIATE